MLTCLLCDVRGSEPTAYAYVFPFRGAPVAFVKKSSSNIKQKAVKYWIH